ncbi:deoxycytidylate deaminase-like [Diabrotica undecimpunctata]|uniref:deoxycytidylate deaminase-like n=1 Tax=Diabrotica undecimpunctata TaxID=50387 RepID=UPI003B63806E
MDKVLNSSKNFDSKREDYLEWEEYFMATAFLAAKRSKDPCSQVGACIVNENNVVVGIGYNGMPKGCQDNNFPWGKMSEDPLLNKYMYVCHAELNAVLNKNSVDVKNCILYVGLFPCNECAKVIIQSGIKEVVYLSDKHCLKASTIASKKMFDAVGIKYRQFIPKHSKIVIDFNEINENPMTQLPETPIKDVKCQNQLATEHKEICNNLEKILL